MARRSEPHRTRSSQVSDRVGPSTRAAASVRVDRQPDRRVHVTELPGHVRRCASSAAGYRRQVTWAGHPRPRHFGLHRNLGVSWRGADRRNAPLSHPLGNLVFLTAQLRHSKNSHGDRALCARQPQPRVDLGRVRACSSHPARRLHRSSSSRGLLACGRFHAKNRS